MFGMRSGQKEVIFLQTKGWGRLPCGQSDGHMTENITFLQLRCRAVKLNDQN